MAPSLPFRQVSRAQWLSAGGWGNPACWRRLRPDGTVSYYILRKGAQAA